MSMNERNKKAVITLVIGLILNIALGASKLAVGLLADSASVSSDAFNNLSDAAVSVVTIIAVALAARAADYDHPYGHGRYEYIATFILGAVIVAVGVEVLIGGIERAVEPVDVDFDTAVWATLGVSVGVKGFMAVFYTISGRKSGSDAIKAAAVDSMSDAFVTTVVLCCALAEKFTGAHIDGYVSIAVAVVILVFAFRILKNVVSRLLGSRPDPELVAKVKAALAQSDKVLSAHDLVINDYGANNKIAEVDAVFPAEMSFVEVHAECDAIERRVLEETGVRLSVHADPLVTDDPRLTELCARLDEMLEPFGATAHEVAIDECKKTVRLDITLSDGGAPLGEIRALVGAETRRITGCGAEIGIDYI